MQRAESRPNPNPFINSDESGSSESTRSTLKPALRSPPVDTAYNGFGTTCSGETRTPIDGPSFDLNLQRQNVTRSIMDEFSYEMNFAKDSPDFDFSNMFGSARIENTIPTMPVLENSSQVSYGHYNSSLEAGPVPSIATAMMQNQTQKGNDTVDWWLVSFDYLLTPFYTRNTVIDSLSLS